MGRIAIRAAMFVWKRQSAISKLGADANRVALRAGHRTLQTLGDPERATA
jgi:hypothetical protein